MSDCAKLIEALAVFLWPISILLLIFLFRPAVAAIIESARSRKFTLKIGGQELTMEEAHDQERQRIDDLQTQLVELQKRCEKPGEAPTSAALEPKAVEVPSRSGSILWVNDNPKDTIYLSQQLLDKGVRVDLAVSTSAGLKLIAEGTYDAVISDMGRTEGGAFIPDAGLKLLKEIRGQGVSVPFIICSKPQAVKKFRESAMSHGATGMTSSQTELLGILQKVVPGMTV